jgi:hypothetical protein
VGKAGRFPANDEERKALYSLKYDAAGFWNALAQAGDPNGAFVAPKDLLDARYVGTEQRIIEDQRLYGVELMKALLEELDAMDDKLSKEEGLDPLDWKESRQRAPENDDLIWSATLSACRRFQDRSPQMRDFVTRFSPPQ